MPHEIDIEAGKLLRFARQQRRMSQDQLAKEIGVTFQQIQKYEKGRNRMGASKIWEFSQALSVPPGYFFPTTNHAAPKLSKEDVADLKALRKLPEKMRKTIRSLANCVRVTPADADTYKGEG